MFLKQKIFRGNRPGFFYKRPGSFSSLSNGLKEVRAFCHSFLHHYFFQFLNLPFGLSRQASLFAKKTKDPIQYPIALTK